VVYFAPDLTDVTTIARAHSFLGHGLQIVVFAFRRGRYNPQFKSPWPAVELGRTVDGRSLQRGAKLVAALVVLWRNLALVRTAHVLYARNIDQLVLAVIARLLARSRARLVYEVVDVASVFTRRGAAAAIMRWVERRLLKMIDAMVVSSPAFHRCHYLPVQGYRGRTFVIENRLHPSAVATMERSAGPAPRSLHSPRPYTWIVGYFGLIRGGRTFDLITRLAERFPDILFYFRGIVTTVNPQTFATAIATHENMVYGGAYVNPDDLKRLYGSVDFTWAVDLEHEEHNSRWLMPCRFYESSLIGVPCIAARGFEVGKRIDALGIGWTLAAPYEESFARLFAKLSRSDYQTVVDRIADLPIETFVVGDEMTAFCRFLKEEAAAEAEPATAMPSMA
jgi:succinoglycan biosynthesis protein ExoL